MSQTLAVAARELRERWLLFPTGLALGCVPLVLPAFGLPPEGAPMVGLLLALLLGTGAALLAGASMLARDATDGRLEFLFSRPLAWPAIWGGKWLGALVLVAGSGALAALPWMVVQAGPGAHGGSWRAPLLDSQGSAFFLLLLLLAIGIANFNATAFRSRSAWVALDLALLLLAAWLFMRWVAPLYFLQIRPLGPPGMGWWGAVLPVGPVALALFLASAPQVAVGRTDLRRAHRVMSLTFWSLVFVALAAAGLRLAWARGATPADLTVNAGSSDPSGRWLYARGGSHRGGATTFLIDTDSGRYVSMGLERRWGNRSLGMAFATDGSSGVALQEHDGASAVRVADLRGDEPRLSLVPLESSAPPGYGARLALSPSGNHALLFHGGASLFALPSGNRLAAATLEPGWGPASARFTGEATARAWFFAINDPRAVRRRAEMLILEVSADGEARRTRVPLEAVVDPVRSWPHAVVPDAGGRRVLTRDAGVRLRDGETGALLATLVEGPAQISAAFLADGRIVVGEAIGARTVVHVFAADGTPLSDVALDRVSTGLALGPEVAPGRLAVHFGFTTDPGTVVVDVTEGRVVESLPSRYVMPDFWMLDGAPHAPGAPASTTHFLMEENTLVRRDFVSGEERVVAGPGAARGERLPAD